MKKNYNNVLLKSLSAITAFFVADGAFGAIRNDTFSVKPNTVHIIGAGSPIRRTNRYVAVPNDSLYGAASKEGECIEYFIKALDRGCYNFTDSRVGVYAECSNYSSTELLDVIDANFSYIVPYSDAPKIYRNCQDYRSLAVGRFLQQKDVIERSARKNNPECVKAKNDLDSAKKCYTAIMASSGSFLDPLPECDTVPGGKIKQAGKYGYSNLIAPAMNMMSGQFTTKTPNWREAVEAVLAGYIMQAQTSCDEDDFSNLSLNTFTPDNQTNFLKEAMTQNLVNGFTTGNATAASLGSASSQGYDSSSVARQGAYLDAEIAGSVFTIEAENIPLSKGRLEMILTNPSFYDISNSVDIAIARNIYGTLISAANKGLFNQYVNDLAGKTNIFIIKSATARGNECAIYKAIGGQVISVPAEVSLQSKKISSYIGDCDILKTY